MRLCPCPSWCSLLSSLLVLTSCARTVQIQVPAQPAVALSTASIAVVVDDRSCRDLGDAVVTELNARDGLLVDPQSPVRLEILRCGQSLSTNVDVHIDEDAERRRVSLAGRSHALAVVKVGDAPEAHLVGAARHGDLGSWGDADALGRRQAVARELTRQVAADLASQVDPSPRLAERRVFPKAAEGSPRRLHSLAVEAELSGDLLQATELAREAHDARPTARTAAYVKELETRLQIELLDLAEH